MDIFEKSMEIANKLDVNRNMRSISAEASRAIYYFPVLCSKSIPSEEAAMAVSNIEAAYASFIRTCFAMYPAMVVKGDIVSVEDYLKKFHQNIGINAGGTYDLTLKEATEEWKMFPNEPLNEATILQLKADAILNRAAASGATSTKTDSTSTATNAKTGSGTNKKDKDQDDDDKKKTKLVSGINKWGTGAAEKKNSMAPTVTTVDIAFIIKGQTIVSTIPVGIKASMHGANSSEIKDQIVDCITGKTGIFHNLVKYSTGEVNSLKDIIFGTNRMKRNISKRGNSDVAIWLDAIDHRKRLNKLPLGFLGKKPFLPNISIMISMDDVYDIQGTIGFNLFTDVHRVVKFMRDNFLLSFSIVDSATETFYVIYDGHSRYEEYPFATLKRENSKSVDASNIVIKGTIAK